VKPNLADHPTTHWIRTAVITIVVAVITTLFLSTCVRPWLERETALAPAPVTPSATVAPTQTARVIVQVVTATPAPVDTPVVCPMICPSSQHLAWCLGLHLDGADDVAACFYQLSDLDRLATDTVNMNATEAWAGVPQEVPCGDPPARHTPIHLISRTTVRGYPASFGPNLGQAEGGLVRPLVEARVSREDGNLWYHLLEIPTNDNPFGVSGWIRAAYADCLALTATPVVP
jgi:hypothetical protein